MATNIEEMIKKLEDQVDKFEKLPEYEKLKNSYLIENDILSASSLLNNMKTTLNNPCDEIDDSISNDSISNDSISNDSISNDLNSLDAISSEEKEGKNPEDRFVEEMNEIKEIKNKLSNVKDLSIEESLKYYTVLSKLTESIGKYLDNKKLNITYLDDK